MNSPRQQPRPRQQPQPAESGSRGHQPSKHQSPGARKEKLKQRDYRRAEPRATPLPYAELRVSSAFSFLRAASQPEDLIEQAAALGLSTIALNDRNGVYGAPRIHAAARQAGLRALVGAEVVFDLTKTSDSSRSRTERGPLGLVPEPATSASNWGQRNEDEVRLTLLVETRRGYRNLCRLLTDAARDRPKGEARADWQQLERYAEGLCCLTGGDEGPLAHALADGSAVAGVDSARRQVERLAHLFPGRLWIELQRHDLRAEEHRNRALVDLARRLSLPLVATNGVRYARRYDKRLQDVLTAIRHGTSLDRAGRLLSAERERHLKPAEEMARRFSDLPAAVVASADLADRLDFTLEDLGYRFPDYPLPQGETPIGYLRHITWNGARARFRPLTARAQAQIEHELALIEKLDLAGYFLIVWDIVRFCQRHGILAQGRGSAANSAVCYALAITAVDPVKMELLFERFLSEERGEWPDIDLDLPSGEQREVVIQYVYKRYGPNGAAMTANVITYRERSAAREAAKALGFSREQEDRLSKQLGRWGHDRRRGDGNELDPELIEAGFDPTEPRVQLFVDTWQRIHHLPRHLGQHSGGMVIAAGRLDEVVPLEPASMEGRTVVQWDKDDCADLGIIKVDLLGLGMLKALEEIVPLIRRHEGVHVDLAHLPPDDPKTYRQLQRADTVGVFQVESRAQMASLPRNRPKCFYDLVIQVAIIRPGPIAGNLAHPYFERRLGREEVTYPHPSLEKILQRTLGVPIFQEQILKVAMEAAGFSGGEAEELRRAMGFKRSVERMESIENRLRRGMTERGILGEAQEMIVQAITSFALYGFPESHAASFALIAYASAYLKAHHPTAFLIGLLNAWPMGFYGPASLIQDAKRHGVRVLPIDVQHSHWRCRWQDLPEDQPKDRSNSSHQRPMNSRSRSAGHQRPRGAARLGLRFVHGLRREVGERIETERRDGGEFKSVEDLGLRCRLRREELATLAAIGALGGLHGKNRHGLTRRTALWQAARVSRAAGPLLSELPDETPSPLPEMSSAEETAADFHGTSLTIGDHPVAHLRAALDRFKVVPAGRIGRIRNGRRVRVGGSIIVRQRPGTAKGILFLTLEDETGMIQAIVSRELFQEHRKLIVGNPGLIVEGILQRRDGSISVRADRFWPIDQVSRTYSHDFH